MEPASAHSNDFLRYRELKDALLGGATVIALTGKVRFTKSGAERVQQSLRRDFALEGSVKEWIANRGSFSAFSSRLAEPDPGFIALAWPRHYAFRIPEGDSELGNRENVFVYFPHALGFRAKCSEDVFSIELIDVLSPQ